MLFTWHELQNYTVIGNTAVTALIIAGTGKFYRNSAAVVTALRKQRSNGNGRELSPYFSRLPVSLSISTTRKERLIATKVVCSVRYIKPLHRLAALLDPKVKGAGQSILNGRNNSTEMPDSWSSNTQWQRRCSRFLIVSHEEETKGIVRVWLLYFFDIL